MSDGESKSSARSDSKLIRVPLTINFILLLALIGPGSSHKLDLALRRAGLANAITLALQAWFVGSTVFATAFFIRRLVKKSDAVPGEPPRSATFDSVLLLVWWIAVILACLYAFMMGMGG
jgi:hypothetical protein